MRKKIFAGWLLAAMLLLFSVGAQAATPEDWSKDTPWLLKEDYLYSDSALIMDEETGEILFSKNSRVRMNPASTTKIMTLLLGIESGIPMDQVITVPDEAADIPKGSSLVAVFPGEQLTFGDLLKGTMLNSGNDGANAIAVLVSGSIPAFVDKMNARAAEIGCEGTRFSNAHGFTADGHYTTAQDLALIAQEAMKNETFREIVALENVTINISEKGNVLIQNRAFMVSKTSQYYYPGCIGIKTGFTNAAGYCFVGAAEFGGRMVITVALHSTTKDNYKWVDTQRMFDYAKTRYTQLNMMDLYAKISSQMTDVVISNASRKDPGAGTLKLDLAQLSDSSFAMMVLKENESDTTRVLGEFARNVSVSITDDLTAPVTEGEIIGNLTYDDGVNTPITGFLIASRSVAEQPAPLTIQDLFPFLKQIDGGTVRLWLILLAALLVILILLRIRRVTARNRRRRRIYNQRKRAQQRARRDGASGAGRASGGRSAQQRR